MKKKEVTLREHLSTIQSKGGKARWANLSPEERTAQARKAIAVRWAKAVADHLATKKPANRAASRTEETAAPKPASKKSLKRKH